MTVPSRAAALPLLVLAASTILLTMPLPAAAQDRFETPPTFRARDILPAELIAGPNHRVDDRVENDGFLNHYTISSRFGSVSAVSTAELRERVHEMNVAAALDALAGTDEFAKHLGAAASEVFEGAGQLITQPVSTVSGAVSGVGKLFQRAGDSLFGDPASASEDSAVEKLIGFSSTKRDYAKAFGVDPYSANPVLQEKLDQAAWAGYLGDIGASAALVAVPGGAGVAVSVARGSETLEDIDVSVAPSDLRRVSRQRLEAMGVSGEIIDLFLGNTAYAPTGQSALVAALAGINDAAARDVFVKVALATDSRDVAAYRARQAALFAGYHRNVEHLVRFEPLAGLAAARTAGGKVIVVAPTDYVAWTAALARTFAGSAAKKEPREAWLSGGVSERTRAEMERRGWTVVENAEAKLLR